MSQKEKKDEKEGNLQKTESRRLTRASTDQSSELTLESKTTQKQSLSGAATPREEAVKTQTTVDNNGKSETE